MSPGRSKYIKHVLISFLKALGFVHNFFLAQSVKSNFNCIFAPN